MAEGILFGTNVYDKSYNWIAAFNDPEFVAYITQVSGEYVGYEEEIPDQGYYNNTKMTKATFPSCYKRIGSHAFDNCILMSSIVFSRIKFDSTSSGSVIIYDIGEYAFKDCKSLSYVYISVPKKIGSHAFENLSNLYRFTGNSSQYGDLSYSYWMTEIGDYAFANCSKLYELNNTSIIGRIGKYAFSGCSSLRDLYVGRNICKEIDDYAFANCTALTRAFFNYSPYAQGNPYLRCKLGSHIFEGCTSLNSITIYGNYDIKSDTFGDLKNSLTQISLKLYTGSYTVVSMYNLDFNIGENAFTEYSLLNYIDAECVNTIGSYAFSGCISLPYINAGYALCKQIDDYAYAGCTNISYAYINNYVFSCIDGSNNYFPKMILNGSNIFNGCTSLKSINLWGCGDIPSGLFSYRDKSIPLQDITIGGAYGQASTAWGMQYSVTVGSYAFAGCPLDYVGGGLANVIETFAFAVYKEISNFYFGSYLCKEIQSYAFSGCKISQMTFNMSHNNIQSAQSVYLSIASNAFQGCQIGELKLQDIEYIGEDALTGCSLSSLYMHAVPSYNLSITSHTFIGCMSLSYCDIFGFTYIDDYAFTSTCPALNNLPNNQYCSYIGSHAFENLSELSNVNNVGTNTSELYIGDYAFAGCINLSSFMGAPTVIGSHAFENCSSISNINGNVRLKYVGAYAFANCYLYTGSIPLWVSASFIGSHAFENCSNMSMIILTGVSSVPVLESIDAFNGLPENYTIPIPSSLYQDFLNDSVWGLLSDHLLY